MVTISRKGLMLGARSFAGSYRYSHIIKTLRALSSSTKTSMRIDEDGLLSLQFLMPKPRSNSADPEGFVEFRVRLSLCKRGFGGCN